MSEARGRLEARFERRGGRTELVRLRCQPPLQALRALRDGAGAELVVATLGPGLMGGDRVSLSVRADPGTQVRVTSTGATRVLTARAGLGAEAEVRLEVAPGARLVYLPRPTILQAGASYRQRLAVWLDADALALVGDVLVPGRLARGEAFEFERLDASLEVHAADGELLVAERQRIAPTGLDPRRPGALSGGEVVLASLFVLAPGRDVGALGDRIAAGLPAAAGVTALPNRAGLLVRGLVERAQAGERLVGAAAALVGEWARLASPMPASTRSIVPAGHADPSVADAPSG